MRMILPNWADDHELAGHVDEVGCRRPCQPRGGLHVDDALAAAGLEAALADVAALAVAVLQDREDEAEPNSQNGNPLKIKSGK